VKAQLVSCFISRDPVHSTGFRDRVKRLVIDAGDLGMIAITPEDSAVHVMNNYDQYQPHITHLKEVDLPDEFCEKVIALVRARNELSTLGPQVRACMTD